MGQGGDFGNFGKKNSKLGKSRRSLFLTLFAVFFFLILGIFFISYSANSNNLSQGEFIRGESFNLKDNESLKVRFEKERHDISVRFLGANAVEVTVSSEPVIKNVRLNETTFFDLNNDSKNDLRVFLVEIVNYKATLEFKRVDGGYCNPNWECNTWGNCNDGLRKRECVDVMECGKSEQSPVVKRFCASVLSGDTAEGDLGIGDFVEANVSDDPQETNNTYYVEKKESFVGDGGSTCLRNNASICLESQKCRGNWINSSDSLRCCFGGCYSPQFNLTGLNSSIFCDRSITSFRTAVSNCTFFKMNCVEHVLLFGLGIVQGFESVFEIQGYSNTNCIFSYGYGDVFINYSDDKMSELIGEGKSLPQINFELETLEVEHIQKYQNKEMICYYPQSEFLSFARDWEDGKTSWSKDILGKYECSGTLAGI